MKKFLEFLYFIFFIIFFLFLLFYLYNNNFTLKSINQNLIDYGVQDVKKEIYISTPILNIDRIFEYHNNYISNFNLTNSGILEWTNFYRRQNNLLELKQNNVLDKIATLRAKDMFEGNYFAHYSDLGIGAPQIAEEVGYEYISIGENIALGNFKDDKELVDAWMNSPNHKANILSSKYNEIGIAVMYGDFYNKDENKIQKVWIAVQVFGKSIGDCQKPDENLKNQIEILEREINILRLEIENLQKDLFEKINNLTRQQIYNYNSLVNNYNKKIAEYKNLVVKYNLQVEIFNQCINL